MRRDSDSYHWYTIYYNNYNFFWCKYQNITEIQQAFRSQPAAGYSNYADSDYLVSSAVSSGGNKRFKKRSAMVLLAINEVKVI